MSLQMSRLRILGAGSLGMELGLLCRLVEWIRTKKRTYLTSYRTFDH